MQLPLRKLFLVAILSWFSGDLFALNPPPANDSAWGATSIGVLPVPPACPLGGYGNTVIVNGSTLWASYNTFDFSPAHCFASGSPDVWYKFVSTSTSINIDALGFNGLDTFFVKLFLSQGSCFSLVPLSCETSINGFISMNFLTPNIGEEYYIQIGGNDYYKAGDFTLTINTQNICNECVNESSVVLDPAPWFGRYGTSQTVNMCYTVDRWDYIGGADLHGIVPRFGLDWDISSLVPISSPQSYSATNAWHWFTNISTPDGPADGYFFDPDNDGDPSNNEGDSAGILDSWEACWKINTLPYCNTYDLSVNVNTYCDVQTGTGAPAFSCDPSPPLHMGIAGWCCPQPGMNTFYPMSCASQGTTTITGVGNTGDLFNITVYDTGYTVMGSMQNTYSFSITLPAGDYNVEVFNVTTSCIAYTTLTMLPYLTAEVYQTQIGCGSGTAEVFIKPSGGTQPYTYNFTNHPLSLQTDSIATQVPDGWIYFTVTDSLGCTYSDSMWVISTPQPLPYFDYPNQVFCTSEDSIPVQTAPLSPGGVFVLVSPLTAGITVDPNRGTIFLNNTSFPPPFWLYVKYSITGNCPAAYIDSVQIYAVPPAPVALSPQTVNYCIGAIPPVLIVSVPSSMYNIWYDVQTTGSLMANSYPVPLSNSTQPGLYYYAATTFFTFSGGCTSAQTLFIVNAIAPPAIIVSDDTTICPGDTAKLNVNGCPSCTFVWSPQPTISSQVLSTIQTSPAASTAYSVVATDPSSGCISVYGSMVNIDASADCNSKVIMYTGITPNSDGHNDSWIIDGIDSLANVRVAIFNRWGKEVWTAIKYDNNNVVWRGTDANGNALPDGTYYYILVYGDIQKTGWIELSH